MTDRVVRLPPLTYIHVHDSNTNLTSVVLGPTTYTVPPHQQLVVDVTAYVVIPPAYFALITNPVKRDPATGKEVKDKHGQVKVNIGEKEYRFAQEPFPLYPQEVVTKLEPLTVLKPGQNFVLRALTRFEDDRQRPALRRNAGDEYLYEGPGTYQPRVEEEIVEQRNATIVKEGESLLLKARNRFNDPNDGGVVREVGEEYLYSTPGQYTVGVNESLVRVVKPTVLTRTKALHVAVKAAFKDKRSWARGVDRLPGQTYLVTSEETAEFTPHPCETITKEVNLLVLTRKQWAVILDPFENGATQLGKRKVVTNTNLFLRPGEKLESGVLDLYVLSQDEALLLTALDEFSDVDDAGKTVSRTAGELWLLRGPREYIPNEHVSIMKDRNGVEKRTKIILGDGEGVYVRNTLTGEVRLVTATTFMLAAQEELWEKDLPPIVEEKLARQGTSVSSYMEAGAGRLTRDKTRVVRFSIPHNAVTQVYDFKKRTQRTIFGPDAVLLGPDEQFTVLSLSGSDWDPARPNVCLPKQTDKIKALYLYLGPASLSDVLHVETADHARLALQLSYDWYFDVAPGNVEQANDCFKVPDFVGDCCSCIASRVRASIASCSFDNFHKNSAMLVRTAVFGTDRATGKVRGSLRFPSNRLVVTSVDIQEIEILDDKTRAALQQSVKMAIEITTQSQEAAARQEASVREQEARGKLERQTIADKSANEVVRKRVIESESAAAAIESTGQAKAEARARARAADIEGQTAVTLAKKKAETATVEDETKSALEQEKRNAELDQKQVVNEIEVHFEAAQADIESDKFKRIMQAVEPKTISALAKAGPELQARLLKSLGLEGFLVTDGTHPINLFTTAKGMTAPPTTGH